MPLVGHATQVVTGTIGMSDGETGPNFNMITHSALLRSGQWSDGLFDLCSDWKTTLCAFFCTPFLTYSMLRKSGAVKFSFGDLDKTKWLGIFLLLVLAMVAVDCVGGVGPNYTYMNVPDANGKPVPISMCLGTLVILLLLWLLSFSVLKGIRDKFLVVEADWWTCLKSFYFVAPNVVGVSCMPCAYAQASRHVDRLQGW